LQSDQSTSSEGQAEAKGGIEVNFTKFAKQHLEISES
jgi:hypothetical protein